MTTQLTPDRAGLPPPLELELIDADRAVGWISGGAVGFRGFSGEVEAAHAAWAAYRALSRRLAPRHGARPIPVSTEPLALQRQGEGDVILASGRPIARLVRPGPDSRSGPDTFGFEIRVPAPADEGQVRAMAHVVYRTLRRSGIRWAMWRPAAPRADGATAVRASGERANGERTNGERANDPARGPADTVDGGWWAPRGSSAAAHLDSAVELDRDARATTPHRNTTATLE